MRRDHSQWVSGQGAKRFFTAVALCLSFTSVACGDDDAPATAAIDEYEQVDVIRPVDADSAQRLTCFCVMSDGRIVAVVNRQGNTDPHGNLITITLEAEPPAESADEPACEVRILDADGKPLARWPVDFQAQAVNVGVDGNIVLGGDGFVARYDQAGKQLAKSEAPHLAALREDPEALDRQAREMVEQQSNALQSALESMEAQKKALEEKPEAELSDEEQALKGQIDQIIKSYKDAIASQPQQKQANEEQVNQQVEQMKQMLLGRQRKISAIAAGPEHVFITCAASKGYGYGVWRTDLDFQNPVRTVDGLSGCCGQMDVQCCAGELIVAENARHRVVRYDADGKELASFGKRSRDGEGENFGGCCNPMNTRLLGDKLYVAESDGRVKLFTLAGEYLGLVGKAKVRAGCKSSIVDVAPDAERVYYFDVENSSICLLKRVTLATADAK